MDQVRPDALHQPRSVPAASRRSARAAAGSRCAPRWPVGKTADRTGDGLSLIHIFNAAVARHDTQIHTHMCYCEFNDIMDSIAALAADVITIETSRSDMELLESFEEFRCV